MKCKGEKERRGLASPYHTRMPRRSHVSANKPAFFSFGPFARLYSEEHFLDALAPLGMTRRSLRAFFRALSVPTIEIGSTRLVDHLSLVIALRAVLRVGEPDFLAPTSVTLSRGASPDIASCARRLDPDKVRPHLQVFLAEVLAATRSENRAPFSPRRLQRAVRTASARMANAALTSLPLEEQNAFSRRAVAAYASDPFFSLDGRDATEIPHLNDPS